jgi:hypothetical protein
VAVAESLGVGVEPVHVRASHDGLVLDLDRHKGARRRVHGPPQVARVPLLGDVVDLCRGEGAPNAGSHAFLPQHAAPVIGPTQDVQLLAESLRLGTQGNSVLLLARKRLLLVYKRLLLLNQHLVISSGHFMFTRSCVAALARVNVALETLQLSA